VKISSCYKKKGSASTWGKRGSSTARKRTLGGENEKNLSTKKNPSYYAEEGRRSLEEGKAFVRPLKKGEAISQHLKEKKILLAKGERA